MSIDTQKQIRENTLELQEFLKDLKQWESKAKEKDKKLKTQVQESVSHRPPIRGQNAETLHTKPLEGGANAVAATKSILKGTKDISNTAARHTYDNFRDKWDKFDVDGALRELDEGHEVDKKATQKDSSSVSPLENKSVKFGDLRNFQSASNSSSANSYSDANSEKDLGNKYFKEKKYVQAIECYSRCIALQPSAVAYANRAMAYIKIRRFKEAEADCTDALALDDRYVKAYSRRATARKEIGSCAGAVEDAEFALRLEPENKELINQYSEAKSIYDKNLEAKSNKQRHSIPIEVISSQEAVNSEPMSEEPAGPVHGESNEASEVNSMKDLSLESSVQSLGIKNTDIASAQTIAAQVVAAREVTKAPKTFYEFESIWKSFSSNPSQQAGLLKVMNPTSLPIIFKDNLSPKFLSEIVRRLVHLFPDDVDQAIQILDSLTLSKRFSLTVMCLSSKDKADLRELWDTAFVGCDACQSRINTLNMLRQRYQL